MVVSFDKYEVRDLSVVSVVLHLKGDNPSQRLRPYHAGEHRTSKNECSPLEPAVTEILFSKASAF